MSIKPAPVDWWMPMARGNSGALDRAATLVPPDTIYAGDWYSGECRHSLAALSLHGQPFGFTWDDVDLVRMAADDAEAEARPYPSGCAEARAPFDALADRIEALLPPREAK